MAAGPAGHEDQAGTGGAHALSALDAFHAVGERQIHQDEVGAQRAGLEDCLREHGSSPSKTKEAGGIMAAMMKGVLDVARDDSPGRNARDGFATEHMEIASYQLLERVAKKAGDRKTAAVARQNREEEEAMARSINAKWNKIVDLTLREEGVRLRK